MFFHGGQWRVIRYKEVAGIYGQSGAKKQALRLFVVAPVPYRLHSGFWPAGPNGIDSEYTLSFTK
jgi:hypothetical protein